MAQNAVPQMPSNKDSQMNALAAIIPQVMNAVGGGDRRTQLILMKQQEQNNKNLQKNNLQNAMRAIYSPGTGPITPELITKFADLFKVPYIELMQGIQAQQAFKGQNDAVKREKNAAMIGNHMLNHGGQLPGDLSDISVAAQLEGRKTYNSLKPDKPDLFKSYNSDGTFTWQAKSLGATGMPQADDRATGWIGQPDGSKKYGELTPGTISHSPPKTGMEIISSDGTSIRTNVPQTSSVPTRGTKGKLQDKLLEANNTYANIKSTIRNYDDSFLLGRDKLGFAFDAFKEKWNLGTVTPEEKQKLKEYTTFKRDAVATLNEYIKQITGAAMSEAEASRLMKAMPNPGINMFDGDSPTQFKAKQEGVLKQLDRVTARSNYVLRKGFKSFKDVSLGDIDPIIDKRGEEIEAALKQQYPEKTQEEIETATLEQLSEEFGVRF